MSRQDIIDAVCQAMLAQVECMTALAQISDTQDSELNSRVLKAYEHVERLNRQLSSVMIAAKYTEIDQA